VCRATNCPALSSPRRCLLPSNAAQNPTPSPFRLKPSGQFDCVRFELSLALALHKNACGKSTYGEEMVLYSYTQKLRSQENASWDDVLMVMRPYYCPFSPLNIAVHNDVSLCDALRDTQDERRSSCCKRGPLDSRLRRRISLRRKKRGGK